jgi:hypothetical protein
LGPVDFLVDVWTRSVYAALMGVESLQVGHTTNFPLDVQSSRHATEKLASTPDETASDTSSGYGTAPMPIDWISTRRKLGRRPRRSAHCGPTLDSSMALHCAYSTAGTRGLATPPWLWLYIHLLEASTQPHSHPASRLVHIVRRIRTELGLCASLFAKNNNTPPHHTHNRPTPLWKEHGVRADSDSRGIEKAPPVIPTADLVESAEVLAIWSC